MAAKNTNWQFQVDRRRRGKRMTSQMFPQGQLGVIFLRICLIVLILCDGVNYLLYFLETANLKHQAVVWLLDGQEGSYKRQTE